MSENYANASEVIRNLAHLQGGYEVLLEHGRFRIVRLPPPFFSGYEFWVVNEKGFLWEPAESEQAALDYLDSDEAREYNQDAG